jgi:glycerol kinase
VVSVLVLDVGTSGVRVAVVRDDLSISFEQYRELLPTSPGDGLVEFDAVEQARVTLDLARQAIEAHGTVDGVAISNQRVSTIAWDATTREPLGPALGWQDLRTIGLCFAAREHGLHLGPNQMATKAQWLLDTYDADRGHEVRVGTVDTWVVSALTDGAVHVTDATNAATSGLTAPGAHDWSDAALRALRIDRAALPRIVDSAGAVGAATALPGAPPIVAVLGDQQASLAGQSCVARGDAKITFGTGGMLDVNLRGESAPHTERRAPHGTFPIVAWRVAGATTWGAEAIMLAAGTNVQWLRDDLGLIASSDESDAVAASCSDSGGVVYVPAPMGLGTPQWDFGARAALFGLTRGSERAHIVRAVLEGVAQRGADLVDAAVADCGLAIPALRIDGGMSDNTTFVQALADATQRPVEISPIREATTRGAALFGLLALGAFSSVDELAGTWSPRARVEPKGLLDRDRWRAAVARAEHWIPELSAVDF